MKEQNESEEGVEMYLSKFCIKNFRCFNKQGVEIDFRPGINVTIGENNTGKSALIDALRLVFSSGPGRREIYVTPQDFYVHEDGIAAEEIAFDLTFSDLSDAEEAGFYEMLVIREPMEAQFHIRYRREKGSDRIRTSLWGGEKEGQPVNSQTLELINHTFLGALRDAERHLRPGRGSHIGQLIRKLVTVEEEKDNILKHMKRANRSILQEKNIKRSNNIINTNLNDIYGARLAQQVNLGFVPPDFGDVVDLLRPLLHPSRDSKVLAAFTREEWDDLLARCSNGAEILKQKAQAVTPFARLFNAECPEARIEIPCGILTDDDRCTAKTDPYRLTEQDLNISFAGKTQADAPEMRRKLDAIRTKLQQGEESARANNARALENGNLLVKVAYKTFEYELARITENLPPMIEALEKIHPSIVKGIRALFHDKSFDSDHKAICVWLAVKDAKAEFAQRLAALLEEHNKTTEQPIRNFIVPQYIREVIGHVAPVETPILSVHEARIPDEERIR